jgi:hypothetical protein
MQCLVHPSHFAIGNCPLVFTIEKPLVAGGIKSLEDYVKERGGERVIRKV